MVTRLSWIGLFRSKLHEPYQLELVSIIESTQPSYIIIFPSSSHVQWQLTPINSTYSAISRAATTPGLPQNPFAAHSSICYAPTTTFSCTNLSTTGIPDQSTTLYRATTRNPNWATQFVRGECLTNAHALATSNRFSPSRCSSVPHATPAF